MRTSMRRMTDRQIKYIFMGLLFVALIVIFWPYILGRQFYIYEDLGSDTAVQYYPYYLNVVRKLAAGNFSLWDWDYGLGTTVMDRVGLISEPFAWIVIGGGLLFGSAAVKYFLVWAQIARIITSFFLTRYFLKLWNRSELSSDIAAFLYAFSGFMMLWGQHYMFASAPIYLMALLILAEKMLREGKISHVIGLAIMVALSLIFGYYMAYMMLAFLTIYVIFRMFHPENNCRIGFVRYAIALALGFLLSTPIFLSEVHYITSSSNRLDQSTGILSRIAGQLTSTLTINQFGEILSRFLSNNLLGQDAVDGWQNYYEMPQLVLTCLFYFFLVEYFLRKWKSGRRRALLIGSLLGLLMLFAPISYYAYTGFSGISARWTYVLLPVEALIISYVVDGISEDRRVSILTIILGGGMTLAAIYYSYSKPYHSCCSLMAGVCLGVAVLLILFLLFREREHFRTIISGMMLGVMLIFSIWEANYTTNHRDMLTAENFYDMETDSGYSMEGKKLIEVDGEATTFVSQLLDEVSDDSFYRVEEVGFSEWNPYADGMVGGFSSLSCYDSTINYHVEDFYDKLYTSGYHSGAYYGMNGEAGLDPSVLALTNTKYIASSYSLNREWLDPVTTLGGSLILYRNTLTNSLAKFYQSVISQSDYEAMPEDTRNEILLQTLIVPDDSPLLTKYGTSSSGTFTIIDDFDRSNDSHLSGNFSLSEDGLVFLAIPAQEGWHILVDGEEVESYLADYAFYCVEVPSGTHEIEAEYRVP